MSLKQDIINSVEAEINVIKHLHGKIPKGKRDWRPNKSQRSIKELLNYIETITVIPTYHLVHYGKEIDYMKVHKKYAKEIKNAGKGSYSKKLDKQFKIFKKLMDEVDDSKLKKKKVKLFWGTEVSLHQGLIDNVVKFITAYRMQLFLYSKMAGNREIFTSNNWAGIDYTPKKKEEEKKGSKSKTSPSKKASSKPKANKKTSSKPKAKASSKTKATKKAGSKPKAKAKAKKKK